MKVVYRVLNGVLKGWQKRQDDYILKPNEIEGGDFKKPAYVNGEIIETWTVEDQATEDENNAENNISLILTQSEIDGISLVRSIRATAARRRETGNITIAQYKTIRLLLNPTFAHLRCGDWDLAQDEINNTTAPGAPKLLTIYNKLKNQIGAYLES